MGTRTVPEALRAAGAVVECHQDHFAPTAPDEEWLRIAGKRGWVVITKDRRIRFREAEKASIIESKALAFLIISANIGGEELASILVRALPAILQLAIDRNYGQIYQIGRNGKPVRVK